MALNTDRHMDGDEVERYSMGTICETESARFEEHLLVCELCRNRVTETDEQSAALHRAAMHWRRQPRRESLRAWFPQLIPVFSAVCLVGLLALVGLWLGSRTTATQAYAVNLISTRGVGIDAKAPRDRPLNLSLELTGMATHPTFRVEVVERQGTVVWEGMAQPRASKAEVSVPGMHAGIYFVRVYSPSGELLREYGIDVTN